MVVISVSVQDRRKSKVQFDNVYFKVYDDAIRLISYNFGASKGMLTGR